MEQTTKQLTVKEALEQGYTYFFYNFDGWQCAKHLADIDKGYEVDWTRDDIFLASKEPVQSCSLSEGSLKEWIVDNIESQYSDETNDDDSYNTISEAFKDFDFKPFEDAISKVLETITHYRSTNIKLVP